MPDANQQDNPNTFFIIKLFLNKKEFTLGPYYDISTATQIAVDFIPFYARALSCDNKDLNYKMELQESVLQDGEWISLSTILKQTHK